jgi:hypothetical protein
MSVIFPDRRLKAQAFGIDNLCPDISSTGNEMIDLQNDMAVFGRGLIRTALIHPHSSKSNLDRAILTISLSNAWICFFVWAEGVLPCWLSMFVLQTFGFTFSLQ